MEKIILKKLEILNFKGKKKEVFEFKNETSLYGDNATGKTTVGADAITWLFFGKNSADESKFNVKTLDSSGVRIPNVETSVKGWFDINGTEEVFERILFEKWVKKHGETIKEYTGDETKFFINAAPKKKSEFDREVGSIISPELFKVLSSPLEFNRLPWEKRRETLIKMAGNVDIEPSDKNLLSILQSGKHIETYKQELKGKIKLHKDNLQGIPSRIDEVHRGKSEPLNWNDLNGQIESKQKRITEIKKLLNNEAEKQIEFNKKQQGYQKKIGEKQLELQNLESELTLEANKDLNIAKGEKVTIEDSIKELKESLVNKKEWISIAKSKLEESKSQKDKMIVAYREIKATEFIFDESKSICPTCKQSLPENEIEETKESLLGNFNENKATKLANNIEQGKSKKIEIEKEEKYILDVENSIPNIEKGILELETKLSKIVITEVKIDFSNNKDHSLIKLTIESLQERLNIAPEVDNSELETEKQGIESEIKAIEQQLNTKSEIEKADKRIAELQKQQSEIAQQIADLEKDESIVLSFEKSKMNMLEEKVNGMFKLVKFRMFEPQKNGGEKPQCVTLINGVPYSDANTASKINAGIDIINVISDHYKVYVPIIVDNRESITSLLPVKSQIINLIKDENYKTLTVK